MFSWNMYERDRIYSVGHLELWEQFDGNQGATLIAKIERCFHHVSLLGRASFFCHPMMVVFENMI